MSQIDPHLTTLPWLPRLADSFRSDLKSVEQNVDADWGNSLRALASQYLGINQAIALARTHETLRSKRPSETLSGFRLGMVSNATVDFLKPFLIASALRFGVSLEIVAADFGQVVQEAVDPNSLLNRSKLDGVLLAIDHRGLPFRTANGEWPLYDADTAIQEMKIIRDGFRENSGATCIVQTIPAPAELILGSLDAGTSGTLRSSVAHFNADLVRHAAELGEVVIDIEWLAQCIGLDQWYDDRQWFIAKMPCSHTALPLYGDFVARTIAAIRGKSRKCLVLDLDNTLWGGVIGDDGLEGIALHPGDPRGESHRAVQSAALDLRKRGVVLAVCSKNDESTARLPFREHPGMILSEDDIAVFIANWDDKATNIERIAAELELGLDSIVLLDDNPVERAQVRSALPEVAVPELGADASSFVRTLLGAGYFESVGFTKEDLARAEQYKANSERSRAFVSARNLDSFLESLQMEIDFKPFASGGRKRIAQLINKTNQFNVTTRRYSEQQVAALEQSPDHYCLQVALRDRYGDNGMISVVICEKREERWEIDTWLMSCRVLNRGVEQAVCNRIAGEAMKSGAKKLIGRFVPTDRNRIVADLFERLGFERSAKADNSETWVLELQRFAPFPVFVKESTSPEFDAPDAR
jgi:FkbH-like protein